MNFQHSFIAVAIQLIVHIFTRNWICGAFAGSFYFIGREYAQAEQRVIQQFYYNHRDIAPILCGLESRAWTLKGMLDWVLPTISVSLIAVIANHI